MKELFSLRMDESTIERLKAYAEGRGEAPRTVAQRLIDEGLRQADHPLIRFTEGPAGRRATLIGSGLDIWEVIAALRANDGQVEVAIESLDLPRHLFDAAVVYYGAFTEEIDAWIQRNARESERGYAAWKAGAEAVRP